MENWKVLDRRYETITWGIGLIWIGILGVIPGNQNSIGVLSIGLILLGLNLARYLSRIPTNNFTTVLGILASLLGLVMLLHPVLNIPPFEVDLFPLVLIVIGLYILIPDPKRKKSDSCTAV